MKIADKLRKRGFNVEADMTEENAKDAKSKIKQKTTAKVKALAVC